MNDLEKRFIEARTRAIATDYGHLNPRQLEGVLTTEGPLLLLAGAGSGKTTVLINRVANLLRYGRGSDTDEIPLPISRDEVEFLEQYAARPDPEQRPLMQYLCAVEPARPWEVLAITFTNKAANELKERLEKMLGEEARDVWAATFHSACVRILRRDIDKIGFDRSFTIYDTDDSKRVIKDILKEMGLEEKTFPVREVLSVISNAKDAMMMPEEFSQLWEQRGDWRRVRMGRVYAAYNRRLRDANALDFDDIIFHTVTLLQQERSVLDYYQRKFRYVLVDEYQDTNYAQYVIIRRLSQLHSKVCVVGDDAQSIYSFRGAKIENILSFQKDFPAAKVFKLEQNYRSTRTIVDAANSVIVRNSRRMEKHCFSAGDVGEPIRILKAYTDREEAEMVVSDLRDKVRSTGDDWSEAVILYRTNNQSAVLEDNLRRRGIPYRIYKGSSFYDHKEVKDMLAYIRLVINPRDDEAFKRIVNYPTRGIGDTTVQRIAQLAAERGVSMWEAVDALVAEPVTDPVQRTIARKVADFVAMIRALSLARNDKGLYDFGLEIASRSGIIAAYRTENTPEAASALDNIEELLNSMQEFKERCDAEIRNGERPQDEEATIEEWLQNVMLVTDMDKDDPEDRNKVTLMTVHSAKGLEYKYVYIVGLEENLFPSQRAAESPDGMEEERRLFYVALTRAKVEATISYAEMRFKWGNMEFSRPSCFLREIDPRYIESDADFAETRPQRRPGDDGPAAIDELRRRFDYRFQQKQQAAGGNNGGGRPGSNPGRGNFGGRPSDGESGPARRFARAAAPRDARPQGRPDPALVQAPRPSTDGMRRIGVRQAADGGVPLGDTMPVSGDYTVGQRVEHPKFGVGIVQRIETLATDHKLVVAFDGAGEKTQLAKFAKLTKL